MNENALKANKDLIESLAINHSVAMETYLVSFYASLAWSVLCVALMVVFIMWLSGQPRPRIIRPLDLAEDTVMAFLVLLVPGLMIAGMFAWLLGRAMQ